MERRLSKVELFELIRRDYQFGDCSIRAIANKFGIHRRTVRQALENALPPARKQTQRERKKISTVADFIDSILEQDRKAPRKQRHTAHRIFTRIRELFPNSDVAETTVRHYVRQRKIELGLLKTETFVPQAYSIGQEAQVDWYEATVILDGVTQIVQVFSMRSMFSGGAFHLAYPRATQQAFLQAHELAFHYFGGVFSTCRYDNLSSAVKKILRGRQREQTERFIAFRSHWGFAADFCTPASGHEKGGVEGEVGYFRRNHLVPVPQAEDFASLNEFLHESCREDQKRLIGERSQNVGVLMSVEQANLQPLVEEGFELAEVSWPRVNPTGCVKAGTNSYSAPLRSGTQVRVRLLPTLVEIYYLDKCVATHPRCYGRHQQVLSLEHYLDVLERKPGAMAGSKPLKQWRDEGRWPESYDRLWESLNNRLGKQAGTRALIELLQIGKRVGYERLTSAIGRALELGTSDSAVVKYLLSEASKDQDSVEVLEVGDLERYLCPLPEVLSYDLLLEEEVISE